MRLLSDVQHETIKTDIISSYIIVFFLNFLKGFCCHAYQITQPPFIHMHRKNYFYHALNGTNIFHLLNQLPDIFSIYCVTTVYYTLSDTVPSVRSLE